MSTDPLKELFDADAINKGTMGFLGATWGDMGAMYGSAGKSFGEQGADNVPKFDAKDHFDPESYFQLGDLFDPQKLWNPNDYLVDSMKGQ